MIESLAQICVLVSLSQVNDVRWQPAVPHWKLLDSQGKIIRIEPGPEWKPAIKHPLAAAMLGKPIRED